MYIPWTARRQVLYFSVVLLAFFGFGIFIWINASAPTCFDNKQNQKEVGVDCGGPCSEECLGEVKEPVVLWSQALKIGEGKYDAAAVVLNQNLFLTSPSVKYQFKLYDKNNVLIVAREGETFINPGRQFAVFESNIDTGRRVPYRTFLELDKNIKWKLYKDEPFGLIITQKDYSDLPRPSLSASISNKSINEAENIRAVAIIYDEKGNTLAASATEIESIKANSSQEIFFTWSMPFEGQAASNEVFLSVAPPLPASGF